MANKILKANGPRLRNETKLLRDTQVKFSRNTVRLFRNTVGAGFVGPHAWTREGFVIITRPTRITFGLCPGSADLIGWRSLIIQPEDVGKRFARFVAIEGKTPGNGRVSPSQRKFLRLAWDSGALAGVARTLEDAEAILRGGPFSD